MSKRRAQLANRFMLMAHIMADQSACKRGRHACILLTKEMRVVSIGYNGPAASLPNRCKHDSSPCGCVHAEANACIQPRASEPYYAFITAAPCEMCAQLLRNVGVRVVLYDTITTKGPAGLNLLQDSGVGSFMLSSAPSAIFDLS